MADGEQATRATSSREDQEVALAAVEKKFRTLGTAGTLRTLRQRYGRALFVCVHRLPRLSLFGCQRYKLATLALYCQTFARLFSN